ncbi:DUF4349 domain-containing protein [Chitinimonas lacunae]|uniref:DUF4349 domain-containing protein n=1 Tax=Chitinimonas lacunae TaxID=1963018 RepID=A0ABV8MU26_9NEIS
MNLAAALLGLLLALTALFGCSDAKLVASVPDSAAPAAAPAGAAAAQSSRGSGRYLAVSHHLLVQTTAARIESLYRDIEAQALALGGEVVSSRFSQREGSRPEAELTLRLPPARVAAFHAALAKGGRLIDSRRDSEDKTAEVIDVEARLKNLTEARDRLRSMLATPATKLADVLEVQKALTETQSQLDSLAAQRKVLAQLTELERITVQLQVEPSALERSAFEPLRDAWNETGHLFASSLAALLSFTVITLPWLLLGYLLSWPLRRAWRRRREARRHAG